MNGSAVSEFDNPLSTHFDENDCMVYFDDVKIPWERVFVHNNAKMSADIWHAIPVHVMHNYPCQVRLMVKMRFLLGLARRHLLASPLLPWLVTVVAGWFGADLALWQGVVIAFVVNALVGGNARR